MRLFICGVEAALQDEDLAFAGADLHFDFYLQRARATPGVVHVERGGLARWDPHADRFVFSACVVVEPGYDFAFDPIDALRPGLCEWIVFSEWEGPFD